VLFHFEVTFTRPGTTSVNERYNSVQEKVLANRNAAPMVLFFRWKHIRKSPSQSCNIINLSSLTLHLGLVAPTTVKFVS